ncbi:MAG TPA: DUF2846 domain-containing protein [Roseiarcus sp.]|jgi:hypothetical protein
MTNKIIRRLASIGIAALLAGCATGHSFDEVARAIPPLRPNQGRIYFVRSDEMVGFGLQPSILLNDEVVGVSRPGGFFFVDRPPGDYTASASTEVTRSAMFHLSAGETKYITTALTRGILIGHVLPVLEYPEQGQSEVRQSRYIGPPLAGSM